MRSWTALAGGMGVAVVLATVLARGGVTPSSRYLQISVDPRAREIVLRLGPVDLPPGAHHVEPPIQQGRIPVEGWIHGFKIELFDGEGRPIPRQLLHHFNLIDPDHRELFLPIARRIMAAGSETDAKVMPRLLGHRLERGQRVLAVGIFHNPTEHSYRGAWLRVTLPYTPIGRLFAPRNIYPFYIDVMFPVGAKSFDLPPGRSQRSWEGRPAIPGRILGLGGHLHTYAVGLRLEDVTAGDIIWMAEPTLDDRGRILSIPTAALWWRGGARLSTEHTYRITAFYDNPTGTTIADGAMGAIGGIFLPERGAHWPTVNESDPLYVADLEWVSGGGHRDKRTSGHRLDEG